MYYVAKTMEIAGAHALTLSYESKCEQLHGHNWIITVYCKAEELNADGMVCDFKHIKDQIHGYLDHGNLNDLRSIGSTIAKTTILPYESQRDILLLAGRRPFYRYGRHFCPAVGV